MTLDEIDKTGLIRESYRIDGIEPSECRSIFLDWALKLPMEVDQRQAIELLIEKYANGLPEHPMSTVLCDGLGSTARSGRRGGAGARTRGRKNASPDGQEG